MGGNATGVIGVSKGSNPAVLGTIVATSSANNSVGVRGETKSTGTGGIGVFGQCDTASGIGVFGSSVGGTGLYGQTSASFQYGILGTTYAANSTAIAGTCTGDGSSAFSGGTVNPNAFAGVFQGNVVIQGRLVVSDPSYKSGALMHPDGSHRLVYCVESPESWIEDFGKGTLTSGKAAVTLDKDFAAVVHTDDYHVFLTEYSESHGLYVSGQTAGGFTVQERGNGTASGRFSWRVVAKPKSTVKSGRLNKFTMPNLPLPKPPTK